MDEGDIIAAVSSSMEFKDILAGAKADAGLGKLEKRLQLADNADVGMLPKDVVSFTERNLVDEQAYVPQRSPCRRQFRRLLLLIAWD